MASQTPSLLEKQDHLANSGASSALSEPSNTELSAITYTEAEEKALVRKIDWALLPGLTFLYLLSFLDRSNIGNAKAAGMMDDIGLKHKPESYNTALALFFLGYVLFEIPANIVLKKFNPRVWLPTLTVAFGICSTLQCLISNEPGFYLARFALGCCESGLFPGIVFVFSMFYKRKERTVRVSIFFGGAALAGAFGGILAWGLATKGHIGGPLHTWKALFAVEGIFTTLVGISAYFWVPSYPRQAKFLNERERAILIARLQSDSDAGDEEPFSWNGVWQALKDPLVNAYGWLFHLFAFSLYSLSLFLPTIIAGLGFASWKAQLMTVPVYATAFAAILFFCYFSHKINARGPAIAIAGVIGIVGYVVIETTRTAGARYAGVFIAVIGIYAANALLLAWPSENVSPQTKRATSTAMQIFIGDIGAIAGVLVYRPDLSAHFYRIPHGVAILYTGLGVVLALAMSWRMHIANQTKNEGRASRAEKSGQIAKGDRARGYLFQI
ncbi:uncharacterized protein JCM15063_005674 [Sporobolomyces koalae]|uniref:uncharacterized protein n=1 Tax=Sporobolomyces koalae TaxID=500713 RepID=UPI003172714E